MAEMLWQRIHEIFIIIMYVGCGRKCVSKAS